MGANDSKLLYTMITSVKFRIPVAKQREGGAAGNGSGCSYIYKLRRAVAALWRLQIKYTLLYSAAFAIIIDPSYITPIRANMTKKCCWDPRAEQPLRTPCICCFFMKTSRRRRHPYVVQEKLPQFQLCTSVIHLVHVTNIPLLQDHLQDQINARCCIRQQCQVTNK